MLAHERKKYKNITSMSFETLSQPDFDLRRRTGELSLTLIGMSNVGKSHWSRRLAEVASFNRTSIDDLIEQELGATLHEAGYSGGIEDVAKWMGQPYEPQSEENQQKYLHLEEKMMLKTIKRAANPPLDGNVVVDTTGSVVHIEEEIARELAKHSTVVYLMATPEMQDEMFVKYMQEPKPVVWGGMFSQEGGEVPTAALARSYPKLLEHRSKLYQSIAHVTIPHANLLAMKTTGEFLEHVRRGLPESY